jgi:hypothetical protein
LGGFAPAHYLKQFHPKYVSEAELDNKVKDAKYDSWVRMFHARNDWALNPELPVLSPWRTVTPINTPTWTLERNPYSVFVDTAGNQLPYIDRVTLTLAENLEVINLRAIAGEYDFQQRHIDLGKLPVFLENQAKGNYKVYLDPGDYCDLIIKFNLSYDRTRRSRNGSTPPISGGRSRSASIATRSTRRSGSAPARPARWCPSTATSTTRGRSTGSSGRRWTSRRPTRCSTRSGFRRRTRRATGSAATARGGCASRS